MGSSYAALDSAYIYVKDLSEKDALNTIVNADENLPKINIWILSNPQKADLLPLILKPEDLVQTSAIIMLDFDKPWEMMNSITKWMDALRDTIF